MGETINQQTSTSTAVSKGFGMRTGGCNVDCKIARRSAFNGSSYDCSLVEADDDMSFLRSEWYPLYHSDSYRLVQ